MNFESMKLSKHPLFYFLLFALLIILFVLAMQPLSIFHFGESIVMLFPQGQVALKERNLLFIIQAIMLLVIIPVYVLTFIFSWKYSSKHPKGTYDPDLVDNAAAEYIWWGLPLVMTLLVAILTFYYTYEMDPFKPIVSDKKPIKIQVVALQWKWLFLYPDEKIAAVNFVQFPKNTPVHFELTADAPMNSFWIPSLGSQIYAMPKMKTELHLIADSEGDFRGSSANISGVGFSGMTFTTRSSSEEEYHSWRDSAKQSAKSLNFEEYKKLALPSQYNPVEIYRLDDDALFNQILMQYMQPKI
jgi:cytochrome o ubiquinol oxidase subunit 2